MLLLSSVALNIKYIPKAEQTPSDSEEQLDSVMMYKTALDIFTQGVKSQYKYEGYHFKDVKIKDITGKEIFLSTLLDENYKVIFKFSKYNCNVCIEKEVDRLADLSKKVGKNSIIILSEGHSIRQTLAFVQDRKLDIKVFTVPLGSMDDVMEKENMPFLCVMNKEMTAKEFFIPIKELREYTDAYHQYIYEHYLK